MNAAVHIVSACRPHGPGRPRWWAILLLSAAFGLVQAGLIDQSLFNHASFADSPFWEGLATVIPGIDVDADQLLTFVGGHVMWSFAGPIAVIEACFPRTADRPWLGWPGLTVMAVLYVAAAVFFYGELVVTAGFHASPVQLIGTAVVVVVLVATAFIIPVRRAVSPKRVPPAWAVGGVTLLLVAVEIFVRPSEPGPWSWPGVGVAVLSLATLGALLLIWSRRTGWTRLHVLAVAGAPLLCDALLAFAVPAPGNAYDAGKFASNAVFLTGLIALLLWAWRREAVMAQSKSKMECLS